MPQHQLTVDARPEGDRVILVPRGSLDHFSADALRAALREAVQAGWTRIVLDLRHLDFMDAGGIHVLEELRDGHFGPSAFAMVDGTGPVALPIRLVGGPRLLPAADLDPG